MYKNGKYFLHILTAQLNCSFRQLNSVIRWVIKRGCGEGENQ